MGLLCSLFLLKPISHSNHIFRKKSYLLFSKVKIGNWEQGWSQVNVYNFYCWRVSCNCGGKFDYFQFMMEIFCRCKSFWIRKTKYVSTDTFTSIYYAIFNSHLNYGNLVWSQNTNAIKRLTILQKKALRLMKFKPRNFHTCPL